MQGGQEADLLKIADQIVGNLQALSSSQGWKTTQDQPFKVYEKEVNERKMVKAEIVVNISFEQVIAFFQDPSFMNKLSDNIKVQVILNKNGLRVIQMLMELPNPMSNREIVAVNTIRVEGNRAFCGSQSCNYPFNKQDSNSVIAQLHVAGYIIEKIDAGHTKMTNVSDVDIKGSIPGFVQNAMASKRVQNLSKLQSKILGK